MGRRSPFYPAACGRERIGTPRGVSGAGGPAAGELKSLWNTGGKTAGATLGSGQRASAGFRIDQVVFFPKLAFT